jgi:hypothetical protein
MCDGGGLPATAVHRAYLEFTEKDAMNPLRPIIRASHHFPGLSIKGPE